MSKKKDIIREVAKVQNKSGLANSEKRLVYTGYDECVCVASVSWSVARPAHPSHPREREVAAAVRLQRAARRPFYARMRLYLRMCRTLGASDDDVRAAVQRLSFDDAMWHEWCVDGSWIS